MICPTCGAPLADQAAVCARCGAAAMVACPACGSENPKGVGCCSRCGGKLEPAPLGAARSDA
ncbi:MAG: double zinc ribbon domain-containing protein, partial [Geminicoccaceae bacterium]